MVSSKIKLAVVAVLCAVAVILTTYAIAISIVLQQKRQLVISKKRKQLHYQKTNKQEEAEEDGQGNDKHRKQGQEKYNQSGRRRREGRRRPFPSYDTDLGTNRHKTATYDDTHVVAKAVAEEHLSLALSLATFNPLDEDTNLRYSRPPDSTLPRGEKDYLKPSPSSSTDEGGSNNKRDESSRHYERRRNQWIVRLKSNIESNSILKVILSPFLVLGEIISSLRVKDETTMVDYKRWWRTGWKGESLIGTVKGFISMGEKDQDSDYRHGRESGSVGGGGGGKNDSEALYHLSKSAQLGNPYAQYWMGNALASGIFEGRKPNVAPSSSRHPNTKTTTLLPVPGDIGEGGSNLGRALVMWHLAAMEGIQEAQMALGYRHAAAIESSVKIHLTSDRDRDSDSDSDSDILDGGGREGSDMSFGVAGDCSTALAYYEEAANAAIDEMEAGPARGKVPHVTDRHDLAVIHMVGDYSPELLQDNKPDERDEAIEYMRIRAIHLNKSKSAYALAKYHHYGIRGVKQDMRLALKYYEMAAMSASSSSSSSSFSSSSGSDEEEKQIIHTDMPDAAGRAAMFYMLGIGVDETTDEEDLFLEKAYQFMNMGAPGGLKNCSLPNLSSSELDDSDIRLSSNNNSNKCSAEALNAFGLAHLWGIPGRVNIDEKEAMNYFTLARDLGSADASYHLGMMKMGWHIKKDKNEGTNEDLDGANSLPSDPLLVSLGDGEDDDGVGGEKTTNAKDENAGESVDKKVDRLKNMIDRVEQEVEQDFDIALETIEKKNINEQNTDGVIPPSNSGRFWTDADREAQHIKRFERTEEMSQLIYEIQSSMLQEYSKGVERVDKLLLATSQADNEWRNLFSLHEGAMGYAYYYSPTKTTTTTTKVIDGKEQNQVDVKTKKLIDKRKNIRKRIQSLKDLFTRIHEIKEKAKKIEMYERAGVNYKDALVEFARAANKGHLQSMHRAGLMYSHGIGTPKHCPTALLSFIHVSQLSPVIGRRMHHAYKSYKLGNVNDALANYLAAAEAGIELAQSNAAWLLERGYCLGLDHMGCMNASLRLWKAASRQGSAEASLRVGDFYYYGRLINNNNNNNVYNDGRKVVKLEWPFLISFLTHPTLWIHSARSTAVSIVRKVLRSVRSIRSRIKQEEQNMIEKEDDFSNAVESESCINADDKTCKNEQSSTAAAGAEGTFSPTKVSSSSSPPSSTQSTTQEDNFQIAVRYYRKAAQANSARAQFNLGYMYEWGLGVKQDFPLAKRHYDNAAARHHKAALVVKFALRFMQLHEFIVRGIKYYGETCGGDHSIRVWEAALLLILRQIGFDGEDANSILLDERKRKILISHLYNWESVAIVALTVLLCGLVQHYFSKKRWKRQNDARQLHS